jgi:hypothetical protein
MRSCNNRSRILASCLVYRLSVENGSDVFQEIRHGSKGVAPILRSKPIPGIWTRLLLDEQLSRLEHELAECRFSYSLKFQLERLWTNTYLSPHEVSGLIKDVARLRDRSGDIIAAKVVRKVSQQIPYGGPEVRETSLDMSRLLEMIQSAEKSLLVDRKLSDQDNIRPADNAILIHKATVTPTGVYLEGPDEESSNRVLRLYSTHADHFLRVSFTEEDGERINFDRNYSNDRIFQEAFRPVLRDGVDIGEL